MTQADDQLRRLASLAGVGSEYVDAWGKPRHIPSETLRAVLGAMGLAAATAAETQESIRGLEAEDWRALLPPVHVVTEADHAARVPLTVPDRLAGGRVLWRVTAEDGTAREGAAEFADLLVLAQHGEGHDRRRRLALELGPALPAGYHRLEVAVGDENAETPLVVAPAEGHLAPALGEGGAAWGMTVQLYGVRSRRNWGMGDFGDLRALVDLVAERGGGVIGLNPLHALFPAEPRCISPYSPSSRQFLNPLYIDVASVPDLAQCAAAQSRVAAPEFKALLARARAADLVDHPAVAELKQPVFAELHASFAAHHLEEGGARTDRGRAFRDFEAAGGAGLAAFATFTALQEEMLRQGGVFDWPRWPEGLRNWQAPDVANFAAAHRADIERHLYLQWEADRQLGAAAEHARDKGLALGLYRDLAVGVDPNGAEAWADPAALVTGASVGAPPDVLNMKGQDWGLAPVNPVAMRRQAYAPFIAALRANMRHAGVLRIDHVMALKHLYWVPRGAAPADGAYVAYPFDDLRRILALESRRHGCAVVGEDLGTVPAGFREAIQEARVLSYRVLLFERDHHGGFAPPATYPPLAAATFSTHDIATLAGFWLGRDLEWRRALDLYPSDAARAGDVDGRRLDRRRLLERLLAEGLLDHAAAERLLPADDAPQWDPVLARAVHRLLGRATSRLALFQIEDALGEIEQANLPGTIDEHPNWRRRLGAELEDLSREAMFLDVTAALAEGRAEKAGRR